MTTIQEKGGIFVGKSHAQGGIDITIPETGQQIEVEGKEPLIPSEALQDQTIKTYTGTNFDILNQINTSMGAKSINQKATSVHAGDVIICKKTLHDKTIKTLQGTNKQIVSAINENAGCNVIEPGAKMKTQTGEVVQFEDGGTTNNMGDLYQEWKTLVNMTKKELAAFRKTPEGKKAGLTKTSAKKKNISSGQESAEWILKMKDTPKEEWTDQMWEWAKKQINFIKRMSGMKGPLYDKKGNKTRKHTALLIWGHDPKKETKMENGGEAKNTKYKIVLKKDNNDNYLDFEDYYDLKKWIKRSEMTIIDDDVDSYQESEEAKEMLFDAIKEERERYNFTMQEGNGMSHDYSWTRQEIDFWDEMKTALMDSRLKHTIASTGTIYIDTQGKLEDDAPNKENIRISDHEANLPNKRNNPNIEIDISKIDDADDFIWSVSQSLDNESLSYIEDFILNENQETKMDNGGSTQLPMETLLTHLYKEHHEAWEFMDKISKEVNKNNCSECAKKIINLFHKELSHHFNEEEKDFFPWVLKQDNNTLNKLIINELIEQHHWFISRIKLMQENPTPEKIKEFCNKLIDHIKLEEYLMNKFKKDPFKNTDMETNQLTLKQHDIAETLKREFDYISKPDAIKHIKSVFGNTADLKDITIAYNSIDWDFHNSEDYQKFEGGGEVSKEQIINHLQTLEHEKFADDAAYILSGDLDRILWRSEEKEGRDKIANELAEKIIASPHKETYLKEIGFFKKGGQLPSIENVEFYPFMKKESYKEGDLVVRKDINGEYTVLDKVVGIATPLANDMGFTYYQLQSGVELMADDMVPAKQTMKKGGELPTSNNGETHWDKEYDKVKAEEHFTQMGTSESGRTFGFVDEIAPKYIIIKNYLIEKLREKGYEYVVSSTAKSGTIYVYPFGDGNDNFAIRISDHMGRGGVFSTHYDIRNLEAAKKVIEDIPTYKDYQEKLRKESEEAHKIWQKTKDFQEELKANNLAFGILERTYLPLDKIVEKGYSNINQKELGISGGEMAYKYEYTYPFVGYSARPSYEYLQWFRENGDYKTKLKKGGELPTSNELASSTKLNLKHQTSYDEFKVIFEDENGKPQEELHIYYSDALASFNKHKEQSHYARLEGWNEKDQFDIIFRTPRYQKDQKVVVDDKVMLVRKVNEFKDKQPSYNLISENGKRGRNNVSERKISSFINHPKFADGGTISDKEDFKKLMEPKTPEELQDSLSTLNRDLDEAKKEGGIAQHSIKTGIYMVQNNFFDYIVSYNPEMLTPFLEIIKDVPKADRFKIIDIFDGHPGEAATRFLENLKQPLWKLIPTSFKKVPKVKQLPFKAEPDNKNLGTITDFFVGKDDLRPIITGVYFHTKNEAIVATNAHVMLIIKAKPVIKEDAVCYMGSTKTKFFKELEENEAVLSKTKDGCYQIEGNYPDYKRILPSDFEHIITINPYDLYKFCTIVMKADLVNSAQQITARVTNELEVGFNAGFLASALKAMMLLGHDTVDLCFQDAANKALIIVPKGKSREINGSGEINTDIALLMPVNIDQSYADNGFSYNLMDNCVYNYGKLEKLGCANINDSTEPTPLPSGGVGGGLFKPGDFVHKKHASNKTYLVDAVNGNKLDLTNTVSLKKLAGVNAIDYVLVKPEELEGVEYAYDFNKRKSTTEELIKKHPIVLEWTEGADIKNKTYNHLEELEKDLRSFGFTDTPTENYIKNKVWFKGYPHYVQIDLSKMDHDFNPEEEKLINWLKNYDKSFDFEQFSSDVEKKNKEREAEKERIQQAQREKTRKQLTEAIQVLETLQNLTDEAEEKANIQKEIDVLKGKQEVSKPTEFFNQKRNIWIPKMTKGRLNKLLNKAKLTEDDIEDLKDYKYFLLTDKESAADKGFYTQLLTSQKGDAYVLTDKFLLSNIEAKLAKEFKNGGSINQLVLEKKGDDLEALTDTHNFYIQTEGDEYTLTVFDATEENDDDAFIDSISFETMEEAKAEAESINNDANS